MLPKTPQKITCYFKKRYDILVHKPKGLFYYEEEIR